MTVTFPELLRFLAVVANNCFGVCQSLQVLYIPGSLLIYSLARRVLHNNILCYFCYIATIKPVRLGSGISFLCVFIRCLISVHLCVQ
jgi:hypothetical protein